jgi:hypothetical protein
MPIRTHKMISVRDDLLDNGVMTQANSIGGCVKVFVPCEESVPASSIEDIINSTAFITAAASCGGNCTLTAGQDSYSIRVGSAPPDSNLNGDPAAWVDPSGKDWMYFAVMAPTDEGDATDKASRAVYIEQALTGAALRLFPYRCTFRTATAPVDDVECRNLSGVFDGVTPLNSFNCDYCEGLNFNDGEIHTVAAVKRGNLLEHYVDNALVGRVDVAGYADEQGKSTILTEWNNFNGGDGIELNHSGYSGGGCSADESVGHARADWYGVAQFVFQDGAPIQKKIEHSMSRMEEEWTTGNKAIYPGFSVLS